MSILYLPWTDTSKLPGTANRWLIPRLDEALTDKKLSDAMKWRTLMLLVLRENVMIDVLEDFLISKEENFESFVRNAGSELIDPFLVSMRWGSASDIPESDWSEEKREEKTELNLLIEASKDKLVELWRDSKCGGGWHRHVLLREILKGRRSTGVQNLDNSQLFSVPDDDELVAVIAIDPRNNHYMGHVYLWDREIPRNPRDPLEGRGNFGCGMMGIRSSVENIIMRCNEKLRFPRIAQRLAEGARKLCYDRCRKYFPSDEKRQDLCYLEVGSPQGPMPALLKGLGFRPYSITKHEYQDFHIPKIYSMYKHNMRLDNLRKYNLFRE